jgi:hypothetical protein
MNTLHPRRPYALKKQVATVFYKYPCLPDTLLQVGHTQRDGRIALHFLRTVVPQEDSDAPPKAPSVGGVFRNADVLTAELPAVRKLPALFAARTLLLAASVIVRLRPTSLAASILLREPSVCASAPALLEDWCLTDSPSAWGLAASMLCNKRLVSALDLGRIMAKAKVLGQEESTAWCMRQASSWACAGVAPVDIARGVCCMPLQWCLQYFVLHCPVIAKTLSAAPAPCLIALLQAVPGVAQVDMPCVLEDLQACIAYLGRHRAWTFDAVELCFSLADDGCSIRLGSLWCALDDACRAGQPPSFFVQWMDAQSHERLVRLANDVCLRYGGWQALEKLLCTGSMPLPVVKKLSMVVCSVIGRGNTLEAKVMWFASYRTCVGLPATTTPAFRARLRLWTTMLQEPGGVWRGRRLPTKVRQYMGWSRPAKKNWLVAMGLHA